MRNFKRILALVIAVIMIAGTFATLSAAKAWYDDAVSYLENKGIATIGTNANKKISRNEFVFWVAKIESRQLIDAAWNDEIAGTEFSDVTDDHHKAAIAYAARRHFIEGNGDGTFSPDKNVTLAEASAVIVRLMGYAEKVAFSVGEEWKFNNMQVAQTYVKAFDPTFLSKTGTFNPDYELSYGEAAYLLATLLNFKPGLAAEDRIKTADRIDLGTALGDSTGATLTKGFYITKMDRQPYFAHKDLVDLSVLRDTSMSYADRIHAGDLPTPVYTNLVNPDDGAVQFVSFDGATTKTLSGKAFMQLLRVSLGLSKDRNEGEEEPEINAYQYCDVGSVVYLTIDQTKAAKPVTSLTVSSSSVIVDTYLQAEYALSDEGTVFGFGMNSNYAKNQLGIPASEISQFVGWTVRELKAKEDVSNGRESMKPVLPASYTEDYATSWTNIKKNASGTVTEATLNFQGRSYKYGSTASAKAIDVYKASAIGSAVTPAEAVKLLINAAQGECLAVFNDVDGDGKYDNVVVKESAPFLYVGQPDVPGSTSSAYDVYSSTSNGEVVYPAHKMKGYAIGSVILDKGVHHSAGKNSDVNTWDYRTDGFSIDKTETTGKVQLVLRASNMHNVVDGKDNGDADPFTLEHYALATLADYSVGIIETVDAYAVKGFFKASIKNVDGTVKDVLIPDAPNAQTKFNVTIGGATAEYTFDSSEWLSFVTETKNDILAAGIVSGIEDPALRSTTAAWMTGRYVQYADQNGEIIIINATDKATTVTGFVVGVEKTETGDNTFNVKIAKSGQGVVSDEKYYLHATNTREGYVGQWVIDEEVYSYMSWGPAALTASTVQWGKLFAFRYANSRNVSAGVNCCRNLVSNADTGLDVYTRDFTPNFAAGIHNSLNGATADGHVAWTVGADNIVIDQNGKQVYFQKKTINRFGVSDLWSGEVRGSASSIFDWENYAIYSQLFDKGLLINPAVAEAAVTTAGKVLGSDLIYVTVYEDAGSVYLVGGADGDTTSGGATRLLPWGQVDAFAVKNGVDTTATTGSGDALYVVTAEGFVNSKASGSWMQVEGKIQIGDVEETSRTYAADKSYYTATFDFTEGMNPYYYRTWNASKEAFTYSIRFENVTEYAGVVGTAYAVIDETKTVLIPLMVKDASGNTVQMKLTDDNKAVYDAMEATNPAKTDYFVDQKTKNVFKIESDAIYFVTDKDGKVVYEEVELDYEPATPVNVYTGIVDETALTFWTDANGKNLLTKYDTLGFKEADKSTPGWFPGLYTFNYVEDDGSGMKERTLQIPFYSKVIVLTPSAKGFVKNEMTVEEAAKAGIFAVAANFAEDYNKVGTIAVIGEPAGALGTSIEDDEDSTEKSILVYLSANSTTSTQATQFGKKWVVMTNGSAYSLPDGKNVGNIYREYDTYEKEQADKIELDVVGGHWYKVNKNGRIASDETIVTYQQVEGIDLTNTVLTAGSVTIGTTATNVWYLGTLEDEATFVGYYDANGTRTFVKYDATEAKYLVNDEGAFAGPAYKLIDAAHGYYTNVVDNTNFIKDGEVFYAADASFLKTEISATLKGVKTATVVGATAAGATTISFDGKDGVDASSKDFEFFYKNADKTVLYKAGNSTSVTIATAKAYNNAINNEQKAYDKAKSAYDNAVAKKKPDGTPYLSDSRLAYYKNDFDEKASALIEKKNSLLDTYYNGQFWNVPNSPFLKYQIKSQDAFQSAEAKLTFNYIVVDDVYCVFSDEFVLN